MTRLRLLARFARYAIRWHHWPSPLQREHMRGDPCGVVAAYASAVRAGLEDEERIKREGGWL